MQRDVNYVGMGTGSAVDVAWLGRGVGPGCRILDHPRRCVSPTERRAGRRDRSASLVFVWVVAVRRDGTLRCRFNS